MLYSSQKSKEIAELDHLGDPSTSSSTSSLPSQAIKITPALEGAKLFTKARMLFRNKMGARHLISLPHTLS